MDICVINIENGIGDIVIIGSIKYFKINIDGVDVNV